VFEELIVEREQSKVKKEHIVEKLQSKVASNKVLNCEYHYKLVYFKIKITNKNS
jgi:hypothetical protein